MLSKQFRGHGQVKLLYCQDTTCRATTINRKVTFLKTKFKHPPTEEYPSASSTVLFHRNTYNFRNLQSFANYLSFNFGKELEKPLIQLAILFAASQTSWKHYFEKSLRC